MGVPWGRRGELKLPKSDEISTFCVARTVFLTLAVVPGLLIALGIVGNGEGGSPPAPCRAPKRGSPPAGPGPPAAGLGDR